MEPALEPASRNAYIPFMSNALPKITIGLTLTLLLGSAAYLYAVRGSAILLDLAGMARGLLCF